MNSKFITRLLYYLSGFGMGIILVFVLFQNRACNWTPKNQIRQDLKARVIVVNDDFKKEAQKRGITKKMIFHVFKKGSVDFSSSQTRKIPKAYNLYDETLKLNFTLPDYSYISEIRVGFDNSKKIVNSTSGYGDLYIFPAEKNFLFVDSATSASQNFIELGSPTNQAILNALKKNGKIDFSKSDFALRPRALQYLTCFINGHSVGMKTIWYKEKISVYSLEILK